jgi:hypothetical protein
MSDLKEAVKPNIPTPAPAGSGPRMKTIGKALISVGVGVLTIGYMVLAVGNLDLGPVLIIGGLITIGIGIYNL